MGVRGWLAPHQCSTSSPHPAVPLGVTGASCQLSREQEHPRAPQSPQVPPQSPSAGDSLSCLCPSTVLWFTRGWPGASSPPQDSAKPEPPRYPEMPKPSARLQGPCCGAHPASLPSLVLRSAAMCNTPSLAQPHFTSWEAFSSLVPAVGLQPGLGGARSCADLSPTLRVSQRVGWCQMTLSSCWPLSHHPGVGPWLGGGGKCPR